MRKLLLATISAAAISCALAPPLAAQTRPATPAVRAPSPQAVNAAPSGQIDTTGRLSQGDSTLQNGEFYDTYPIEIRTGQQIDIRLTSENFDPYLILRGPGDVIFQNDDEDGSTNARIVEVAPAGGTYQILATSFEPGETGAYSLQARINAGSAAASGQRQTGTLGQGDAQLNSGEYSDAFTIDGRAGEQIEITLNSSDFDPYLLLRGPDGSSFDNDDAQGAGTNSRLSLTLPATGRYRLVVTSYAPGESGEYVLETRGASALAAASSGGAGIGSAAAGAILAADLPVSGQLANGDATLNSGEFFDVYTLEGEPGSQFAIEMESASIDTYLAAVGSGGYEVSNDDDATGRNGTNSRLEVTIPDSGLLTIAATSYAGGETGPYRLIARRSGYSARNAVGTGRSIALGQSLQGTLAQREEAFLLNVEEAGPVRIALSSDAFDPVLRIEGPGGFSAENDDAPGTGTLASLLETSLPEAGVYRVVVTSYGADGSGTYRLEAEAGSGNAPAADFAHAGELALGSELIGTLADGDATISSGEFIDTYSFAGRRGQRVTFDMASSQFDTYLSLQFPGGGREENDDRAGGEGGTDSRLTITLPEDGTYQLVATSYQAGETGDYVISMNSALANEESANPARPNSRVFALSVGVADYERMGSLNMTDQDALKLTQALAATGMMAPESVTLVNTNATRANFEAAIGQIAANIGPDDLFLLFFSGHGAKNDVDPEVERDGSSETIELFDEAIADFELAQMIEPIAARTLLVLDSCFSGGFDGLVNSRVGRMGVFSSDSDVTSLVADKFEAGGYISHILQLAVEGQADTNHDQSITAGELSEFMRTTFYRIALDEPLESSVYGAGGSSGTGYQHIVVNRGGDGMPYEEVLVNLVPASLSAGDSANAPEFALMR